MNNFLFSIIQFVIPLSFVHLHKYSDAHLLYVNIIIEEINIFQYLMKVMISSYLIDRIYFFFFALSVPFRIDSEFVLAFIVDSFSLYNVVVS